MDQFTCSGQGIYSSSTYCTSIALSIEYEMPFL
jgi:hypothetical protein